MQPSTPTTVPKLVTVETNPNPEPIAENPLPTPPPSKPTPKNFIFIAFIVVILLVFVGIGGFLVGLRSGTSKEPQNTPTPSPTPETIASPSPEPMATAESSPGATTTPSQEEQTKVIISSPNLDGFQSSNGSGNTNVDIRVGRNTFAVTRGYTSFDLTAVPRNAAIDSATLRIYLTHISGDPQTSGVSIKVDHMDFGTELNGNDYPLAPLQTNLATLTSNNEIGWKEIVVTEAVQNDLKTNRAKSQYRLRFGQEAIGGTSGGDFSHFESGENFVGTGNIPQLVVKYH